jgi:indolepyruvate ferredoxin oxidoreductase
VARGKRLRGKAIDPFRRTRLRREERRLVDDYRSTLAEVYAGLSESNISDATAIANLPDIVRGYESLKERRISEYRLATRDALMTYAGHWRPSRPPDRETPE